MGQGRGIPQLSSIRLLLLTILLIAAFGIASNVRAQATLIAPSSTLPRPALGSLCKRMIIHQAELARVDAGLSHMKKEMGEPRQSARATGSTLVDLKQFLTLSFQESDPVLKLEKAEEYLSTAHFWPAREHSGIEIYGADEILGLIIQKGLSHSNPRVVAEVKAFLERMDSHFKKSSTFWTPLWDKIPNLIAGNKKD